MNKTFDVNIDLSSKLKTSEKPSVMTKEVMLEPILNNFFEDRMAKLNHCMMARVVNVQQYEEMRIDVQPLNKVRHIDDEETEMAVIRDVPVFCYGSDNSAVLFPIKRGQTVMILFSQLPIDDFKSGTIEPHSTFSNRNSDIMDAIALPSVFPFNRSPNREVRHFSDHSIEDMTVVHNLGTSRENKVKLKQDGSIEIYSASDVLINSPSTHCTGDLLVDGTISTEVDVLIQGRSVKKFMDTHTHNYTDDGSPMVTEKPNEA